VFIAISGSLAQFVEQVLGVLVDALASIVSEQID
jgi:hypothetical protein